MIEIFFHSIAGKKSNSVINDVLLSLHTSPYTPSTDKKVLAHTIKVAEEGNYPSLDYYKTFYPEAAYTYNSLAEIVSFSKDIQEANHKIALDSKLIQAINSSESSKDLLTSLGTLMEQDTPTDDESLTFEPILYSDSLQVLSQGINCGVSEIDSRTHGFQSGCIASICAFTGHGKSTFTESIIFKNVIEGKKVILVSLELAPSLVWRHFEARWMYQVKGLALTVDQLIFNTVPADIREKVIAFEDEFKAQFCSNLIVIDESVLNKRTLLDYHAFSRIIRKVAQPLGGLDLICFDHVGQFELLFPDMGNSIIKTIQSFTKTFQYSPDVPAPTTLFAVQTNREGEKRARKRDGQYDIQAISDLNEVERSSSYILFMYTSDDDKLNQQTRISMAKHRLGEVLPEPTCTSFNPSILTVGSSVDIITASDDAFADALGSDWGSDDF